MNTTTTNSTFKLPFTINEIIAPSVLIWLFFIVGIFLNSLTILVILSMPKIKNPFLIFLFSLCVSDIISAFISPLFWYRRTLGFDVWKPPYFLCKLYWATDLMTSYVTSLHILSFAILRFVAIKYPHKFKQINIQYVKIYVAAIWLFCAAIGFVPYSIFFAVGNPDRTLDIPEARWPACTINPKRLHQYVMYLRIMYVIMFIAPIIIVFILSIMIATAAHYRFYENKADNQSTKKRKRKEKQAVLQLILIAVSFLFAYVPFTAYEMWSTTSIPSTPYYKAVDYWFGTSEYLALRLSECLNPIFYNLGSSSLRRSTVEYLRKKFPCLTSDASPPRGNVSAAPSTSAMETGVY